MKHTKLLLPLLALAIVSCTSTDEIVSIILPPSSEENSEGENENDDENIEDNTQSTTIVIDPSTLSPEDYGATIDLSAYSRNLVDYYQAIPNSTQDQSSILQQALNEMEWLGGGNIIIPAGTYYFADIYMRSNVHLLLSKDTIIKPYINGSPTTTEASNVIILNFTRSSSDSENGYIENCSVSCLDQGERYTIDYSDFCPDGSTEGITQVRFVRNRLVRNFTIADANICDNFTKYCAIIFVGALQADVLDSWDVARPTNGRIANITTSNASHGYGLTQLHAANYLYFENLKATGGVTLRLEGHSGENVGVFNIYAKDLSNYAGKAAVMFQPHVTHNGVVTIDGVHTEGSAFGVLIRAGFIDNAALDDPDAEIGSYSSESTIKNIYSKYDTSSAQIEEKDLWIYEPDQYEYIYNKELSNGAYQVYGASYCAIFDDSEGEEEYEEGFYEIQCTNITQDGFPHPTDSGVLYTSDIESKGRIQSSSWSIASANNITAFD